MSTLYTISSSWHNSVWLYEKLAFAQAGDSILLVQDAVLAAQSPTSLTSFLAKCRASEVSVYLLRDDLVLRGIENKYPEFELLDYAGFVEQVALHDKQVSW